MKAQFLVFTFYRWNLGLDSEGGYSATTLICMFEVVGILALDKHVKNGIYLAKCLMDIVL